MMYEGEITQQLSSEIKKTRKVKSKDMDINFYPTGKLYVNINILNSKITIRMVLEAKIIS